MYLEVLAHPRTSDELRRSTEACLLQRRHERLLALPTSDPEKQKVWAEVMEMVNGMILLKIPNELAWSIYFETRDLETLGERPRCSKSKRLMNAKDNTLSGIYTP